MISITRRTSTTHTYDGGRLIIEQKISAHKFRRLLSNSKSYRRSYLKGILKFSDDNQTQHDYFANSKINQSEPWYKFRFHKPLEQHILLLDCDSLAEFVVAAKILNDYGIGFATVESSHDKYWIIGDIIGTFNEMCILAGSIPGVDFKYLKMANSNNMFHLRLSKKSSDEHKSSESKPTFFTNDLKNPICHQWYEEFRDLWKINNS